VKKYLSTYIGTKIIFIYLLIRGGVNIFLKKSPEILAEERLSRENKK